MAELTGRTGGYSKGKGGSMHMFSEKNFTVGMELLERKSSGAGLAFADKYLENDRVTLLISAMVQLTKVKSMRLLIWHSLEITGNFRN